MCQVEWKTLGDGDCLGGYFERSLTGRGHTWGVRSMLGAGLAYSLLGTGFLTLLLPWSSKGRGEVKDRGQNLRGKGPKG